MARESKPTDGRNRDYLDFDQVEKRQSYRFAESHDPREAFDEETELRTCDISRYLQGDARERERCAAELGEAMEGIGFAVLTGHGIAPSLFERAGAEVQALFTGHPLERKLQFRARRHGSVNQGYFPMQETSDIHPDLVEGWVFCRRAFLATEANSGPHAGSSSDRRAEFWPAVRHEPIFRELCAALGELIQPVAACLLQHLGCSPELLRARLDEPHFGLRLNYYPPVPGDAPDGAGRLLGHEDVNLFTLLPAPRGEGLQVLNRQNFRWIRVRAPEGSIVLNTGDYMQRLSNDRYPSTTHRVSPPREPAERRLERVSFPLNVYLREEEVLEVLPHLGVPKYPPMSAIEFHTRTTAKYYGEGYAVDLDGE